MSLVSECSGSLWLEHINETEAFIGITGINYLYLYDCEGLSFFILLLMVVEILVCFYLLGSTADAYFSPTLANLCDEIGLSHEVAGVTFLALGNGSPDVFSSLAAFAHGNGDAQLGLGALLGAAMFVLNVVLGSVILVEEINVSPKAILRDVSFFVLVVSLIVGWGVSQRDITVGTSMAFTSIYLIYLTVIFAQLWYSNRSKNSKPRSGSVAMLNLNQPDPSSNSIPESVVSSSLSEQNNFSVMNEIADGCRPSNAGVMSAFWHANPDVDDRIILSNGEFQTPGLGSKTTESDRYEFVTIANTAMHESSSNITDNIVDNTGNENANPLNRGIAPDLIENHIKPKISDTGSGWFSPYSETFSVNNVSELIERSNHDLGSVDSTQALRQGLLETESDETLVSEGPTMFRREMSSIDKTKLVFGDIYWRNLRFRRHAVQQLKLRSQEWKEMSHFALFVWFLQQPFNVLRIVTIPTIDPEDWSKYIVISHPPICLIFMLCILGFDTFPKGVVVISFLCAFVLSVILFLTTHVSTPPKSIFYKIGLLSTAFITSVAWIYSSATELVAILSTFGVILRANPSAIGLTVLAWGNSAGDLVGNVAIAKSGFAQMAFHGCFGAPLLNILLGLGLSIFLLCWKKSPNSVVIGFDDVALVTGLFILLTLTVLFGALVANKFRTNSRLGYVLYSIYTVYLVIAIYMSTSFTVATPVTLLAILGFALYKYRGAIFRRLNGNMTS